MNKPIHPYPNLIKGMDFLVTRLKKGLLSCQERGIVEVNGWKNTLDYLTYKILILIEKKEMNKKGGKGNGNII